MGPASAASQGVPSGLLAGLLACPVPAALFIFSLLMPTDFSVYAGNLRLSPYRIVLILLILPAWLRIVSGKAGKMIAPDYLLIAFSVWMWIVFAYHHGLGVATESGGVLALELLGAYGVARAYVQTRKRFVGALSFLCLMMLVIAPLTVFESVTGNHVLRQIGAAAAGKSFSSAIDMRMGLHRAYGPFDHPILYGVFAAALFGMAWYQIQHRILRLDGFFASVLAVVMGAVSSMSAGAIAALMVQFMLSLWERFTRTVNRRWLILTALIVAMYIAVDLASNRSGLMVFVTYLTFSPVTAYGRVMIFEWGMENVWANPIMGLGFNEWKRPSYKSASVDNFWLLQAMMFGIPGFLLLASATASSLAKGWSRLSEPDLLRTGWTVSMFGLVVAGCTVHFWSSSFVYFAFLLGMGVFFRANPMPTSRLGGGGADAAASKRIATRTAARFFQ